MPQFRRTCLYSRLHLAIHRRALLLAIRRVFTSQLQLSRSPLYAILESVKVVREGESIAKEEARRFTRVKTF